MSLSAETKAKILADFGRCENDTGSTEVQVALLTAQINHLQGHFKEHIHDHHSRRFVSSLTVKREAISLLFLLPKIIKSPQNCAKQVPTSCLGVIYPIYSNSILVLYLRAILMVKYSM